MAAELADVGSTILLFLLLLLFFLSIHCYSKQEKEINKMSTPLNTGSLHFPFFLFI